MKQRVGGTSWFSISPFATARLGSNIHDLIVYEGEWWRFFTSLFLHGGFVHILFNAWVMADITRLCEQIYGTARIVTIYFLSGLAGGVASLIWLGGNSVGASGALCGLIGLMAVYGIGRRGDMVAVSVRQAMGRWLIYIMVLSFLIPGIDYAAHIGGAVAGAVLGLLMAGRSPRGRRRGSALAWRIASGALVAATLLAFGAMGMSQRTWKEAESRVPAAFDAITLGIIIEEEEIDPADPGGKEVLESVLRQTVERPLPAPDLAPFRDDVVRTVSKWLSRGAPMKEERHVKEAIAQYKKALGYHAILLAFFKPPQN